MLRRLLILLLAWPLWLNAQITSTNQSFSNGFVKGNDGIITLSSLVGSSGFLPDEILRPTVPASAINFISVLSTSMQANFIRGNGEKRVVLVRQMGPAGIKADFTGFAVADGIELTGNSNFQNAITYLERWRPIYVGTDSVVNVTGLLPNYLYAFTVREYNGSGTETKYLNGDAPLALQTTLPSVLPPTVSASTVNFTNVLSTSMQVNFTPGNGEQRLAILKQGSAPSFIPADNAFYSGDVGNGETAVYNGSGNSFNLTGLLPGTQYFVTIYEFNMDSTQTKYLTTGAPLASQRTLTLPNVFVTTPANGAVNQSANLNVTARAVTGASVYTIELSTSPDFINRKVRTGGRTLNFDSLQYNTMYYTRVKTNLRNDYGQVTTFTTRPAESLAFVTTPANNAVNVNTVLNITSNAVLYASTYTIQLSQTPDFATVAFEVTGPTRTLSFSGLRYNTLYYSRVRTNLSAAFGEVRSFTTRIADGLAFVTSPANGAVNVNNTSLNITCNTVPGAASYTVQLSETPDFATVAFEVTGPTRILAFSGLKYNTTYYNRVITDVSEAYGQVRSFTTRAAESLAFVTSPANNAVNINYNVSITSNAVPGALQYTIQLSESPDFLTVAKEVTGMSRTLTFSGLSYNTLYYNRVRTDLSPNWGAVRSFTTTNPAAYAFLVTPTNNAVNVSWVTNLTANAVTGASFYTIEANTLADFTGTSIVKIGARTQSFALQQNQQYFVRVKTELYPDWGATRTFTTGDVQSLAFITSPANGATGVPTTVNVVANALPGATSYTIELNLTPDFSDVGMAQTSASRTIRFIGLLTGRTYYARVRSSLSPVIWGPVRSFTTINPAARDISNWTEEEIADDTIEAEGVKVTTYPNPFIDRLGVHVQTLDQIPLQAVFLDLNGKQLFQSVNWKTNRMETISGEFSSGTYLLQLQYGSERKAIRVVRK